MDSYFQIGDAERTAWFTSPEVRNIAEVAAMVTKAMDAVDEEGEASIRRFADHAGVPLQPISAEQFTRQIRNLPDLPEAELVAWLKLKDDEFRCASWNSREEQCVVVSGMLSRLMGIYELLEKSGKLDMDLSQRYPEVTDWPAVCVVYRGGGRDAPIGVGNATEFDLEIMDRSGDRFLELHWIRWMSGPYEFSCGPVLAWNVLRAVEEAEAPSPGMVM